MAANFGGIPLAFAFIATFGTIGIVTQFLQNVFGFNLYDHGLQIWSRDGVAFVYLYFQIPLMILVIAPRHRRPARGVERGVVQPRREPVPVLALHRDAGADAVDPRRGDPPLRERVRRVRDRVRLTSGTGLPLVPILIGNDLSGNVYTNPHEGQALAFGMFFVLAAMMIFYIPLQRRASRWSK